MKVRIEDDIVYSPYPDVDVPIRSFYDLAQEKLSENPDRTALVDDELCLTRAALLVRMKRYAVGFRRHGVQAGDRVCVHLNNNVENYAAMYGCILAGAGIVMAKTSLTERELQYQAEDSDCTHILTDVEYAPKVVRAVASLKMKGLFSMGSTAGFISAANFSGLDENDFQEVPVPNTRSTVMAVCYTSGSTGLPKGAEITHYNFVACFYTSRHQLPWGEDDMYLAINSITHVTGLVFIMISVLDGTACAVTSAKLTPVEIMDAVDKYKATAAMTFPAQLQALTREMRRTCRRLPSMRTLVVAGSVLSGALADSVRSCFGGIKLLVNLYGMTESCGIITCQPSTETEKGVDVGVPATGVKIKVVDFKTHERLGPNQMGEICFHNSSRVTSYYKRPKESAELFDEEGWLRTGDGGYYDEDGRLYVADRLKQMIKCMGNQVVPAELEVLLMQEHSDVIAEVSVIGMPHAEYGEAAAAAVVLTEEGREQDLEDLAKRIKATVANNLAVQKHLYGGVFFLDSFPKTETSKVNRPALARSLIRA